MNVSDVLGIKPVANTIEKTTEKTLNGIEVFLKALCMPALEELGFIAHDKVRKWRLSNILKILEKSQGKLIFHHDKL